MFCNDAETARALYQTGAHLYFGVRDVEKGNEVGKDIAGEDFDKRIDVIKLDLGSLSSVREAAKEFLSRSSKLNILINNAGKSISEQKSSCLKWSQLHLNSLCFLSQKL